MIIMRSRLLTALIMKYLAQLLAWHQAEVEVMHQCLGLDRYCAAYTGYTRAPSVVQKVEHLTLQEVSEGNRDVAITPGKARFYLFSFVSFCPGIQNHPYVVNDCTSNFIR